ncbi:MAG TPA: hypothetical protein VF656_07780 [Pyrinomonadaceae bacterium]|jgi:predicted membrane-bound spermidine synthase
MLAPPKSTPFEMVLAVCYFLAAAGLFVYLMKEVKDDTKLTPFGRVFFSLLLALIGAVAVPLILLLIGLNRLIFRKEK